MTIPLPEAEPRLQARYHRLVLGQLAPAHVVAAGLRPPPELSSPLAATQAAWRFYANGQVPVRL